MFKHLQKKWKVGSFQFLLIMLTFALGGSLCGMAGRKILRFISVENNFINLILYILIIVIIWPICVLIISIPFGQWNFFKHYITRIFGKMTDQNKYHIAIFASGAGSNAKKIIAYFKDHPQISVSLIVSNKPDAGVLGIAKENKINTIIIEKERFFKGDAYINELSSANINFIVLAGFLWKIPTTLINAYPNQIINIHPALLPKYGGKGMYGHFVHEAVINAKEKESGITIHYVDEKYDHGSTIFQATCAVEENDSADDLANRIYALEHQHFACIIEQCILKKNA